MSYESDTCGSSDDLATFLPNRQVTLAIDLYIVFPVHGYFETTLKSLVSRHKSISSFEKNSLAPGIFSVNEGSRDKFGRN